MARTTFIMVALCAAIGLGSGAVTYFVDSATDTTKPYKSCVEVCNVRTAWHFAQDGDTILIQVDPIMKHPLHNPGKKGKITFRGESRARGGGNVITTAEAGSRSGFINFNGSLGLNFSLSFEHMDFQGMENIPINIFVVPSPGIMERNARAVAAFRAGSPPPPPPELPGDFGRAKQQVVIFLKHCNFRQNTYEGTGAVAVWGPGVVAAHNCEFIDNKSGGNLGGALFAFEASGVDIQNSQFIRNSAVDSIVGGSADKFYITASTFQSNTGQSIFGGDTTPTGQLHVHSTSFINNAVLDPSKPASLVYGGNFSAAMVTAILSPHEFIVNEAQGVKPMALDASTFETLDGTMVPFCNKKCHIYNRNPGNLNLNVTTNSIIMGCADVPNGPLPCPEGTQCRMLKNPKGMDIGYDCPIKSA